MSDDRSPFAVKDCALIALATGKKAHTLNELRDALYAITTDSIYYHFWGGLLHPRFEERQYNNDFASWVRHALHDSTLAERLAVIDPTTLSDAEQLRSELIELLEVRLDEAPFLAWVRAVKPFEFIRSQIVVFATDRAIHEPRHLAELLPQLSTSAIFYHFIDARRRSPHNEDDFRAWLVGFAEHDALRHRLAGVDPYFVPLTELRQQLSDIFADYFGLAEAAHGHVG